MESRAYLAWNDPIRWGAHLIEMKPTRFAVSQTYVEDCEVRCNPVEISYTVTDEELAEFSARALG